MGTLHKQYNSDSYSVEIELNETRKKKRDQTSKKLVKRKSLTPSFLKPVTAMVINAKPNGKLYPVTRIIGNSLDELLLNCTQVMKMTSAAKKLYSRDGKVIETMDQLHPHEEVYVSLGEPFLDPLKIIRDSLCVREGSFWGLNGLYIPKTKRKIVSGISMSNEGHKMWRILTFSNDEFLVNQAIEIISDLKDIEEVKAMCSTKHNFNGRCKKLFTVNCTEIVDLKMLCEEERYVWNPNSDIPVLGPIWATRNDDLNYKSVSNYLKQTQTSIEKMLEESRSYLNKIDAVENGDPDLSSSSKLRSFSKPELQVKKAEFKIKIKKLEKAFQKFSMKLQDQQKLAAQVPSEQDTNVSVKRAFECTKGLRLKVYVNGQNPMDKYTAFFNMAVAKRGVNDGSILFSRFLDCLSENIHLTKANDFSKGILVRRVFTDTGQEIKEVSKLYYDQVICVSYGDDWIDPAFICAYAIIHLFDDNFVEIASELEVNNKSLREFRKSEKLKEKKIIFNLPIFQHKKMQRIFMGASISVKEKEDNHSDNFSKLWSFSISGRLMLKSVPSLCLTLIPNTLDSFEVNKYSFKSLKSESSKTEMIKVDYYSVQLCLITRHDPNQMWYFDNSGLLHNKAFEGFYLTYLETRQNLKNDDFTSSACSSNIVAAKLLPKDLEMYQRWAFKQESFENLNQWKLCDLPNPEWHKVALTWPIKFNGEINMNLKWPIEGLLLPCVPSLTRRATESETKYPIKLLVLKNNDHTVKQPTLVSGPDLTKLIRKSKLEPYETHCTNEKLSKLEFQMFLDACTVSLKLSSAARRLFDENGNELSDLNSTSNKDLVYVSVGEMWCSPNDSLSRIELRSYANKLAVDLERLKYFMSLRLSNNEYVLGLKDDILEAGAILEVQLINEQSKLEIQRIIDGNTQVSTPEPVKEPSIDESSYYKTSHEKVCEAAKLRIRKKLQQEREPKEEVIVDIIKTAPKAPVITNYQQFIYQSDRILMLNNDNFGLYADEIEKPVLVKKVEHSVDSDRYKWIFHKSGMLESMHFRGFVIAVRCIQMLPFHEKPPTTDFCGCTIILEKAINTKYGKAHQVFHIDSRTYLFYPFFTNALDKNITAAFLSGICSKFVCSAPINQPGSVLDINQNQKMTCISCIGVMNGRYPISSFDTANNTFSCSILGGFKVIKKSLDLSLEKCNESYENLVNSYAKIRQQLVLKFCKNNFAVSTSNTLRILLNLNNNINSVPPQKVTGKSIKQIMEIATGIFNLRKPVRILYTVNGEEIFDDLTFRKVMSQIGEQEVKANEDKLNTASIEEVSLIEDNPIDTNVNLNISLSGDERFFIVEFIGKMPLYLYTLQINISQINQINIFHQLHLREDFIFLFNYEIFNNQINTDLFYNDLDFEGEQTELSIKSSPNALTHFFSKVMTCLRVQLISATISKRVNEDNEFQVDIKSIDAIADFPFDDLVEKLKTDQFEEYSQVLLLPLISTDTFTATEASVKMEIILKQKEKLISDNMVSEQEIAEKNDETRSVETASLINETSYKNTDSFIELWASVGEPFCFFQEDKLKKKNKKASFLHQLKLEIDKKKFVLRTMKGERLKKLNPGTLEATHSEVNPVKIKGNWQFPSLDEIKLTEEINKLQNKFEEIKRSDQTDIPKQKALSRNLYKQKHMKNCLVHINGEREHTSVSVWGESIWEILQNSAKALGMKKPPKYLFKRDGKEVTKLDEIVPGEILAASCEPVFMSQYNSEMQCEIKANWGRARREYGENSTELNIQYRPNTVIDIDPFEPPCLLKIAHEFPAKEPKTIKVFENGQSVENVKVVTGYTLLELLNNAKNILNLSLPVKCFYALDGKRIISFKEILHDDVLAASVSGKGLLTIVD